MSSGHTFTHLYAVTSTSRSQRRTRATKTKGKDLVGRLRLSMYGTREAAAAWQDKIREVMISNDFQQSLTNPCLYVHRTRQIETMVHGDNFVSVADECDLLWLKSRFEKEFEIKSTMIGWKPGMEI